MNEFVIDYTLKDFYDDDKFAQYIKIGKIRECQEKGYTQKQTLEVVNHELQLEGYEPTNLSVVKYYWKPKNKR